MSDFNFVDAFKSFEETGARNLLFIGEDFDFGQNNPPGTQLQEAQKLNLRLLNLRWNTIFTFFQKREDVTRLQAMLDNDARCVILHPGNLEEVRKIPNQFDPRNLNLIALKDLNEDSDLSLREYRRIAQKTIEKFCAEPLQSGGRAYFVGYTDKCWFGADERLLNAMNPLCELENRIIIDNCKSCDFTELREIIEEEKDRCKCFVLSEEALAHQWSAFLPDEDDANFEDDIYTAPASSNEYMFYVDKKAVKIQRKELREVSSFATLLELDEMTPSAKPKYLHPSYFATFLKNTEYPKWFGYSEKYALVRSYQKELTDAVHTSLEHPSNYDHRPILLHGQSGAGKSVALGQLAYDIFHEKQYPVIYISNPNVTFTYSGEQLDSTQRYKALSRLLKTLQEDYHAKSILLIWDCSGFKHERSNYKNLYRNLRNQGLNVTLVCTNYQLWSDGQNVSENPDYKDLLKDFYDIHAKIWLNEEEKSAFRSILKNKTKLDMEDIDEILRHSKNDNFLAILYLIFYDIRKDISQGIHTEFRETVKDVLKASETKPTGLFSNIFAENYDKLQSLITDNTDTVAMKQAQLKDFTIYIAILTYFNMSMSIDMIYGMLSTSQESLQKVLKAPMFVTTEQAGVPYFKIRSRLEAEMLLREEKLNPHSSLHKSKYAAYFARLLQMIETYQFGTDAMEEAIEKITRIISAIGPNNTENSGLRWSDTDFCKYAPCLIAALDAASDMHKDPRLIVQELTLTRELSFKLNPVSCDYAPAETCTYEEFFSIMQEARGAKDEAFFANYTHDNYIPDLFDKCEKGQTFLREEDGNDFSLSTYYDQVHVEIANILLSMARADEDHPNAELLMQTTNICSKVLKRSTPQAAQRAFNTLIWSKSHLLKTDLPKEQLQSIAAETLEKIHAALQTNRDHASDKTFVAACNNLFQNMDKTMDVASLSAALKVRPTPAILYCCAFQACRQAGIITTNNSIIWNCVDDEQIVKDIYTEYFDGKYASIIAGDTRCRTLQMRLYWLLHNKMPLCFSEERQTTHFTSVQWEMLLDICNVDGLFDTPENTFALRFVYALALAQRKEKKAIEEATGLFTSIRADSTQLNVDTPHVLRYLLCHPDGTPWKVSGTIPSRVNKLNMAAGKMNTLPNRMNVLDENNMPLATGVFFNRNDIAHGDPKEDMIYTDLCLGVGFRGIAVTSNKEGHR